MTPRFDVDFNGNRVYVICNGLTATVDKVEAELANDGFELVEWVHPYWTNGTQNAFVSVVKK